MEARQAAAEVLHAITVDGTPLDEAQRHALADGALRHAEPRDRALARLIVATTLRRLPEIEGILAGFLARSLGPRTGLTRAILLTAIAQLLYLDTPPHAAVGLAAALAERDRDARHFKGLVNGVLRNVARADGLALPPEDAGLVNLPAWLQESWTAAYGAAATRAIADLLLQDPPLDLTVRSDPDGWASRLGGAVLASGSVRLTRAGRIEELEGYEAGEWWIQDAAAAVPARLLEDLNGAAVVDLCAAPGGKTAQLAASGARVVAVERDERRAARLRENLARLRLDAEIAVADATRWRPEQPAQAVLLDAPCSSTGIARRHPDVLRRRLPGHLAPLVEQQAALIDAAAEMLRPGGLLVYCTCSLEPSEGEAQVAGALSRHRDLSVAAIRRDEVPGFEAAVTPAGHLRILPHQLGAPDGTPGGSDGFFAARLRKS